MELLDGIFPYLANTSLKFEQARNLSAFSMFVWSWKFSLSRSSLFEKSEEPNFWDHLQDSGAQKCQDFGLWASKFHLWISPVQISNSERRNPIFQRMGLEVKGRLWHKTKNITLEFRWWWRRQVWNRAAWNWESGIVKYEPEGLFMESESFEQIYNVCPAHNKQV